MISCVLEFWMILLVRAETILSAVPDISEGVVHRVVVVNLSFGDLRENIVAMNAQYHIDVRTNSLVKLVKQLLQLINLFLCVLDVF